MTSVTELRAPDQSDYQGNAIVVAAHYDQLQETQQDFGQRRHESKILHLRRLNNWVKSVLFALYLRPGMTVLDMCGGRGGDMKKFSVSGIARLVGVDISKKSVEEYQMRYEEYRNNNRTPFPTFAMSCYCADCAAVDLVETQAFKDNTGQEIWFDLVSCQFSLHYSFETEAKARQMMKNISCRLKDGGHFVCTIPSAERIVKRARLSETGVFGNEVYTVSGIDPHEKNIPIYGAQYSFKLVEAVDDVPEYLIHLPSFARLAREYGLELAACLNFHEFKEKYSVQFQEIAQKIRVFEGPFSAAEWEACGLYQAVVLQKRPPME